MFTFALVDEEPEGIWRWNSNSRDVVARSPSFSRPVARAPQRAYSQTNLGLTSLEAACLFHSRSLRVSRFLLYLCFPRSFPVLPSLPVPWQHSLHDCRSLTGGSRPSSQRTSLFITRRLTLNCVVKVATEEGSNLLGSTEVYMATSPQSTSGLSPLLFGTLESLRNDDGDVNENGKRVIGLDWQNNNFVSPFFEHFFAAVARLQRETAKFHVLSRT